VTLAAGGRLARLALCAVPLLGCGGGAPLLHPAHTLPEGSVTFAAGTSGKLALGGLARAEEKLQAAAATRGGARTADERRGFVQGALVRFAAAPGVAPFAAARVGLGHHNEAGLSYLGRALRVDGRHAFEWQSVALSLGLAGSGVLGRAGDRPTRELMGSDRGLRSVEATSLRGYGLELPVVFGYRSSADVVLLWVGLRGGFERDSFQALLVDSPDEQLATSGAALRLWGGGLVGFAVGLPPIQVRTEVNVAYERVQGHLLTGGGKLEGDVAGWSLTPGLAISAKF
jgi:hypothetical protein